MVAETGIYITWVTGAILVSMAFMPFFKPPYAKLTSDGLIDMFRRYWAHILIVFSVYVWKDIFDGLDRSIMANTRILHSCRAMCTNSAKSLEACR